MYFGFSVQTVPLHHPVRFAERLALLDQLTDGRLLVGVGSGTTPEESIGFGVKFQETSRVSVENLEIIEKLWRKKPEDAPSFSIPALTRALSCPGSVRLRSPSQYRP